VIRLDGKDSPLGHRIARTSHEEICRSPRRLYRMCCPGYGIVHSAIFARRCWFESNKYDESFAKSEDYDLFLRTYESSRYANIPDPLFYYRLGSFSLRKQFVFRQYASKALFRHYARQGRYDKAVANIILRCAKFAAEVGYCAAGAKAKLFARRYDPISPEQKQKYTEEIELIKNTVIPIRS